MHPSCQKKKFYNILLLSTDQFTSLAVVIAQKNPVGSNNVIIKN